MAINLNYTCILHDLHIIYIFTSPCSPKINRQKYINANLYFYTYKIDYFYQKLQIKLKVITRYHEMNNTLCL